MATDLQPPVKPSPAAKYESFVQEQLARAQGRIRLLDLAAGVLGLAAITLAYALLLALADRWLDLPGLVRQIAFFAYAVGVLGYLALVVVRPLFLRLNPYYAARQIEASLPGAKNSVVNWLDLHGHELPPAVQVALGHRAAKDLAKADLEQAIRSRQTAWLGGLVFGLFLGLAALFLTGPRQFFSLLNRAFAPFGEAAIATRTNLTLLRPEGGDVTIPIGRAVGFAVYVEGSVPEPGRADSVRLLFRYGADDPWQERPLERGDSGREWVTTLPAQQVQNGFWYRVAGGDAVTPEYRVQVRSTPLLTGFDVTYHFRPYLGFKDEVGHDPNLRALRGTQVDLVARTNRVVQSGQLSIDKEPPVAAERVADDPQALRFRFVLEKDASYRIWFLSREGERNSDPMAYTIRVLQDQPPQVEVKKPGNVALPANGVLTIEGAAHDDFGVTGMKLRLQVKDGAELRPKVYRDGKPLQQADGRAPRSVEYRDFVELDQLKQEDGQPFAVKHGTEIKYWLEATDNCDHPGPNVGRSEEYTVLVQPPSQDKAQQQKQREQNRQEQKKHEANQDKQLQQQKGQDNQAGDKPSEERPAEQPKGNDQKTKGNDQKNVERQAERLQRALDQEEKQKQDGNANQEGEKQDSSPSKPDNSSKEGDGSKQGEPKPKQSEGGSGKGEPKDKQDGPQKKDGEKQDQQGSGQPKDKQDGSQGKQGEKQEKPGAGEPKEKGSQPKQNEGQPRDGERKPRDGQGVQEQRKPGQEGDPSKSPEKPGDNRPDANKGGNDSSKQPSAGSKEGEKKSEKGERQPEPKEKKLGQNSDPNKGQDGQPNSQDSRSKSGDGQPKQNDGQGKQGDSQGKQREGQKGDGQPKEGQAQPKSRDGQPQPSADKPKDGDGKQMPKNGAQEKGKGQPKEGAEQKPAQDGSPKDPEGKGRPDSAPKKEGQGASKEGEQKPRDSEGQGRDNEKSPQGGDKPAKEKGESRGADKEKSKPGDGRPEPGKPQDRSGEGQEKEGQGERKPDDKGASQAKDKGDRPAEQPKEGPGNSAGRGNESKSKQGDREPPKDGEPKSSPKGGRPDQRPGQSGSDQGEPKAGEKPPSQGKANDRSEGKGDRPGESKQGDQPKGQSDRQPGKPGGSSNPGESGAAGREGATKESGKGQETPEGRVADEGAGTKGEAPEGEKPDPAHRRRAGELQLEEFKKRVNKDVLKKANMTEEEYRQFLKAYEEMLRRKGPAAPEKEKLTAPQRGGGDLANQNARRVVPGASGTAGDLLRGGPAVPPPEFKDAANEFSRRLSELERAREKKPRE